MLERIVAFILKQRVFVVITVAVIAAFGIRAALDLPVEAFPDVQDVQVQIITQPLGQAPEETERTVTLPIERGMSGLPGLTQMRSVSMTGLSVVTLTFSDGMDDYFARQQVMERLQDSVNLPVGMQPSLAPLTTAVGEIFRYVIDAPPSMPATEVRALQDWTIAPALRRVPGVADVNTFGGLIRQYQVLVNPVLLRKFGVSLDQVAQAVGNGSSNAGGGNLRHGDQTLVVRSLGLFRNVDDIARVAVTSHGNVPVLVGDVARVVTGAREPSGAVAYNRQEGMTEGIVVMTKGRNPAEVIAALKQEMAGLAARLPPGVRLHPVYDRTTLIHHTVSTVTENLVVGALLVVSILVIFLRDWRAAIAVAAVIPLSMLFAFLLMDLRGQSANLISLGAVDFGIIIDSAVVLVESLMVRLAIRQAESHRNAYGARLGTLKGTVVDMGRPILFSKAIIIIAFLPIFTFQRVEGKIFSPMAFTLTFALLGAVILTLTLTPAILSFFIRHEGLEERHSPWLSALQDKYRRLLVLMMKKGRHVMAASAMATLAIFLCAPLLGSEFLPKLDEGNIWLTVTLPPSTALDKTRDVERDIRGILLGYPEISSIITQAGRPDDGTDPKGPNNMEVMATLRPHADWRFPDKASLIADIGEKIHRIPGIPTNFSQVIEDNVEEALSGVKGEIAVKIFGPDLGVLSQLAAKTASVISGIHGAEDVAAVQSGGQAELDIRLDPERMARFGLHASDVNNTLQTALGGSNVNTFYEGERQFDVTVRMDPEFRNSADAIATLPVVLPDGTTTLPLSAIADISTREGAARISREAGERSVSIKANLAGRDQGSFVDEAMRKVNAEIALPPGYRMTWGGQFENQKRAMARLAVIVPLSLLLIALLLFFAFRSLRKAVIVLVLLPGMISGGFLGLAAAGLHVSVSAAVGFIALAGISVQNGVIMVEEIGSFLRRGAAMTDAIVDGAVQRLRPILMTGLMAGLGLLPAALSHGIGSETQRPFAVVIVGGIVTSTLFTLLLLPVIYPVFCRSEEE